jgi:phospholipid/cholesterol/gamma-HCH transport system substrate-binding protein
MKTEAKVGLFITISLVFLFGLLSQLSSFDNFFKKSYPLIAKIDEATGLKPKAKVKLKGVDIGYVDNIFLKGRDVYVKLMIDEGVKIPKDSTIALSQDSLLGGKFIDIKPSNSDEFLEPNMLLSKEKKSSTIEEASTSADEAFREIKLLVQDLRDVLNKGGKSDIEKTLSNLKEFTDLLASINREDNKTIHEIINRLNKTIAKFENMAVNISKTAGDFSKMSKDISKTAKDYSKVANNINKDLPAIMKKIDSITTYLNNVSRTLDRKLPPVMDKLTRLEDNLNNTIENNDSKLNKALTSVDGFFSSGTETIDKVDRYLDSLTKSELHVEMRNDQVFDEGGYSKTRFDLALKPDPTRYYMLGVTSSPSFKANDKYEKGYIGNKKHESGEFFISAQYGKRFDDFLFRVGIIENSGGFGVDYFKFNDRLKFSADIYDFNAVNDIRGKSPNLTTTVRYQFFKHLNTYFSANNILNSDASSFSVGIGISFVDNDLKNILGAAASSSVK